MAQRTLEEMKADVALLARANAPRQQPKQPERAQGWAAYFLGLELERNPFSLRNAAPHTADWSSRTDMASNWQSGWLGAQAADPKGFGRVARLNRLS